MKVNRVLNMKSIILLLLVLTPIFAQKPEESVISANNKFATDFYKEVLKKEEPNFLFSPFSVETVLAFAQSGARGQTAQELRSGLHLPDNQTLIENEFKNIFPTLKSEYDLYSFHLANKLYLDKKFPVKEEFKKTAVGTFGADLENVEFAENGKAALIINGWVEDKTQRKIKNLIEDLDPDTVAVIVNALYFKGNWSSSFEEQDTKKRDFYNLDKKVSSVDTMRMYNTYKTLGYGEDQQLEAKFLEMPFQGDGVSMIFALPNDKDGITTLEKNIDKVFDFHSFVEAYVNVSIPKFKTESKIDVKTILQNLGVKKAFTFGDADFSGITDLRIHIDKVIQKTFINVYENGVEAAAATYANFVPLIGYEKTPEQKQFIADHPFIYYIKVKDLIIFAGRVGAPSV